MLTRLWEQDILPRPTQEDWEDIHNQAFEAPHLVLLSIILLIPFLTFNALMVGVYIAYSIFVVLVACVKRGLLKLLPK